MPLNNVNEIRKTIKFGSVEVEGYLAYWFDCWALKAGNLPRMLYPYIQ